MIELASFESENISFYLSSVMRGRGESLLLLRLHNFSASSLCHHVKNDKKKKKKNSTSTSVQLDEAEQMAWQHVKSRPKPQS